MKVSTTKDDLIITHATWEAASVLPYTIRWPVGGLLHVMLLFHH
jgi:hypothetical protein